MERQLADDLNEDVPREAYLLSNEFGQLFFVERLPKDFCNPKGIPRDTFFFDGRRRYINGFFLWNTQNLDKLANFGEGVYSSFPSSVISGDLSMFLECNNLFDYGFGFCASRFSNPSLSDFFYTHSKITSTQKIPSDTRVDIVEVPSRSGDILYCPIVYLDGKVPYIVNGSLAEVTDSIPKNEKRKLNSAIKSLRKEGPLPVVFKHPDINEGDILFFKYTNDPNPNSFHRDKLGPIERIVNLNLI